MKDIIEDIFYEVVKLLISSGYIRMENYFLDGTKIKANANKYTFVWNKAVKRYDRNLDAKVREHLRQIDRIVAEENHIYLDEDLEELGEDQQLTSEQLEGVIESIEEQEVGAYVKYNNFHWEKKKKNRENPFLTDHLEYDAQTDSYICPMGQRLYHIGRRKYRSDAGHETFRDIYQCESCEGCPFETNCKKTNGPRRIRVSHRLNELKRRANDLLCSEKGIELRKRRVTEVEQTFGRLKGCWGFRRFLLRGKNKVKVEFGLLSIAHNITKIALALR